MIESILTILGAGLSLWDRKSKRKYQEKIYKLEKKYYEEIKKPRPDHAVLDDIEFELQLIGRSFASEVKGSKTETLPR